MSPNAPDGNLERCNDPRLSRIRPIFAKLYHQEWTSRNDSERLESYRKILDTLGRTLLEIGFGQLGESIDELWPNVTNVHTKSIKRICLNSALIKCKRYRDIVQFCIDEKPLNDQDFRSAIEKVKVELVALKDGPREDLEFDVAIEWDFQWGPLPETKEEVEHRLWIEELEGIRLEEKQKRRKIREGRIPCFWMDELERIRLAEMQRQHVKIEKQVPTRDMRRWGHEERALDDLEGLPVSFNTEDTEIIIHNVQPNLAAGEQGDGGVEMAAEWGTEGIQAVGPAKIDAMMPDVIGEGAMAGGGEEHG
jgi:hypothetical protein